MIIELHKFNIANSTVAVALSGGSDSMALLHYLNNNKSKIGFNLVAINVEHGIRGKDSINDSLFVKEHCEKNSIPLLSYTVDAIKHAKERKLSIEQSARILRYECFYDALDKGFCDKVLTAHHLSDNAESILLNLFRGTGVKGALGIESEHGQKIIRPFLSVTKTEIDNYVKENDIPFVTDKTNLDDSYTRNHLRLNVIPEIKKVFPEFEKSLLRFSEILSCEHAVIENLCESALKVDDNSVKIALPQEKAVLNLAIIKALKIMGLEKDWEKTHVDAVASLVNLNNGDKITLPKDLIAIKEYHHIVIFKTQTNDSPTLTFELKEFEFCKNTYRIERVTDKIDLRKGFYLDFDKIPKSAVIRAKKDGDVFTKFGGGTKSLGDFMTDKKIPSRIRNQIPLLCDGASVLAVFGYAISELVKVDEQTRNIIKIS